MCIKFLHRGLYHKTIWTRNETENTLASALVRWSAESTPIEWNFAPYYGIILGNEKSQSYRNAKGASTDVAI